jgi:C4-dicarboxylate-specific signal transduction histidine kinase
LNLLKNSQDALLEPKVENPYIKIRTYREEGMRTLEVYDNAGGVPEDLMSKIFEPYFSTKKKKDGTGLGLYMSKTIIEEHCNGTLGVINGEEGAIFRIALPLEDGIGYV